MITKDDVSVYLDGECGSRVSIYGVDPVGFYVDGDFRNFSTLSEVVVWAYNLGFKNGGEVKDASN